MKLSKEQYQERLALVIQHAIAYLSLHPQSDAEWCIGQAVWAAGSFNRFEAEHLGVGELDFLDDLWDAANINSDEHLARCVRFGGIGRVHRYGPGGRIVELHQHNEWRHILLMAAGAKMREELQDAIRTRPAYQVPA